MAFLRRGDYLKQIRTDNLEVVVGGDDAIRKDAERAAQAEIETYLMHRYNMAAVFVDLLEYDASTTYNSGDLITFPDVEDEIYSAAYDTEGESQTVGPGVSPVDDPTKWVKGDPRNALIKMHLVDITLYHLHSRINPRNIPDFRVERYRDCIDWLKMVAAGKISTKLPIIEPEADQIGLKIKWNSNTKFNHNY